MKLKLNRNHFLKALQHCNNIIERRTTVPILANILIDASLENKISLTATDLEISIIEYVPAIIQTKGKLSVSGKMLYEVIRKLPVEGEISLSMNDDYTMLTVDSNQSHFELPTLPTENYPAVQVVDLPNHFNIEAKILNNMFDKTAFAMSTEETRYYLNGIYMHVSDGGMLRTVATDAHRMARMEVIAPKGSESIPGIIISRKTIAQIQNMAAICENDLEIGISETQISVKFDNAYLVSRLVDGNFPDYERIIPNDADKILFFDSAIIASAVDRVATMSSEKTNGVKLFIESNKLSLSDEGGGIGSADEQVVIDYEGESINISFNSKYLLDIADKIGNDVTQMCILKDSSPVVIHKKGDTSALYVIMPMRI